MTAAAARAGAERLNRYLARRGVASRRGADVLITAGRVFVNGDRAAVGAVVDSGTDAVTVDGRELPRTVALRTFAVNKPPAVVATAHDPQGRRTVFDLVDDPVGLCPVGRLDTPSRGLLLLTNDGQLAVRLAHPRYGVTKLYRVRLARPASDEQIAALRRGVVLEDGPARPLSVEPVADQGRRLDVTMGEGRKREVRRLCAAVGLLVLDLQRLAIGPVRLGRLAEGGARRLRGAELAALYRAAGLEPPR